MNVALIVQKTTGYLDLKELLQVRLVNKLWNESAKLNIRKRYISLNTDEKICKIMELLTDSFPLQKFDILVSLRNQNLKNLIRKFGKSFKAYRIPGIDYRYPDFQDRDFSQIDKALMDILQFSPNLQILDFTRNMYTVQATEIIIFLPKLNSFTFDGRCGILMRDQETSFLKKILDASPQLQYLKIKHINVELGSLIEIVANRNIKAIHLKKISDYSFRENSSFNGNFCLELASVSTYQVTPPSSAHITKLNEFLQKYSHTMKYLNVNGNILQFVQIPAIQNLETLKLGIYDEQENSRIQFNQRQFPSLKRLRLRLNNSQNRLNLLIKSNLSLQNLNQLELLFCCKRLGVHDGDDELPASIELPLDLPLLELLRVKSNCVTNIRFPKNVNLRKLIMYNGFEFEQLHPQFPNLKVLYIIIDKASFGSKAEDLWKVFKNLPGLEELTLELGNYSAGTLWKILSGIAREDKDFMKKVINMMRSNMTSLAQDLLSESKPNLGSLNALRSLNIQGGAGDHDHTDASIAIAFLVFCGKLKNLTKLEISLLEPSQRYFEFIFGDILSRNNTRYQFLPGSGGFQSKYYNDN